MAGFKTHITISTAVGVAYGTVGFLQGIPLESSMLSVGLCSVAGILPDLDSDSGIPYRESVAFISAFIPLLLVERFRHLGWDRETIILAAALIYIFIRFVVADIFRLYTVHRGMWHSLPAAASVGLLTFLISDDQNLLLRAFWAGAAVAGFVTHLILDEIYSVDFRGVRLKKSFGSAIKIWTSRGWWPNISTYGKLALLCLLAWGDPMIMNHVDRQHPIAPRTARQTEDTRDHTLESVRNLFR